MYFHVSTLEDPEIDDESCIDPDLCKEYIDKGLNEELLPFFHHKSWAQDFCQAHTLNGCCANLASNLNAKVGLYILSDPRQYKACVIVNFHNFDFTATSNIFENQFKSCFHILVVW